ncbi:MAG: ATP-dependent helicase HrpB [Gemmatimonadetes bacterium]|nr:ATP-dependent helicase HrpB [Gemmatimonadota bacterium]
MSLPPLPILEAIPALQGALERHSCAVLQAPPGAGKTTAVPLALRGAAWLQGAKILMLEPRRLAARAAAHRMAQLLGEPLAHSVGYRVRRDTRVGAKTQIEVVTEGVLTRMLNSDPTLEGVGLVIFDEFHERSLHADLGLALVRHSQQLVRDDLRILVMSATLDGEPIARLLGGAPIVTSAGRMFPVEARWLPRRSDQRVEGAMVAAVRLAVRETEGDILAFLPGQGEIHRVADALAESPLGSGVTVHALYGNLPFEQQDRAIAPSPPGHRKVVLATSIAESSLTIEGVRCVVDSGLSRVARFSPAVGMTRLETVRVSRASAEQRAGRAGRLAPGVVYRLWAMEEHAGLVPYTAPEIADADLAPLALELAAAGVRDVGELAWLDAPPPASLARARELLQWLGALDATGEITAHGARMAQLSAHPRVAHMLLSSREGGSGDGRRETGDGSASLRLACDLAALVGERDILRADGPQHDADLRTRLELLRALRRRERLPSDVHGMRVIRDAAMRALDEANAWRRELGVDVRRDGGSGAAGAEDSLDDAGRVLALAYPDRVAQRRDAGAGRYLLRNGTGAMLRDSPALAQAEYVVVAESDGRRPESAIYLAAPLTLDDVRRDFGDDIIIDDQVAWDDDAKVVRAVRVERLGAITLREVALRDPSPPLLARALLDAVRRSSLQLLPWGDGARRLRERLAFVHAHDATWPDVGDAALLASLDDWLAPHLEGMRRASDLAALDLSSLLLGRLSWQQRSALDTLAPSHLEVPTGSRIAVDYSDTASPVLAVRLQEMFGCRETPRVLGGRIPVTLHLLSPAHRPLQVTRDLAGFWRSSYKDVQKEMKGRYPRHPWPDDPMAAEPTRRAKPRS